MDLECIVTLYSLGLVVVAFTLPPLCRANYDVRDRSSSCNNLAALLFYIDDANRTQTNGTATYVSKPCTWQVPKVAHSLDIKRSLAMCMNKRMSKIIVG